MQLFDSVGHGSRLLAQAVHDAAAIEVVR
jgi:hypothetical protein